jgi:mannose-6-phosphate isomerase-like protein (cupin superfamily)
LRSAFWIILLTALGKNLSAQQYLSTDTVGLKTVSDNIYNRAAFSDSLVSSFVILIKKEVKAHKHLYHAEHVVVLAGAGKMKLGEKTIMIKKGDLVFIPKNTIHSVESISKKEPLKVISIQAPHFDGKDRVFTD